MNNPFHAAWNAALAEGLRVLLTTDTIGGVWTFTADLVRDLAKSGVYCGVAAMGRRPTDAQRAELKEIPGCELFEGAYRLEWMPDPWEEVDAAGAWLLKLESLWEPDLVHCNTLVHAALPWRAPAVLTLHSCVYSWFHAVKRHPPPEPEWTEYHFRVTRALKRARRIVLPTMAMRAALRHYPAPSAEVEVVPNGRSINLFPRPRRKQRHVLAAGRLWDEGKNVALLERISPRLSWPVLLAGDNDDTPIDQEPKAAVHLGQLSPSEMRRRLREAAVFAHPAFYEPFGLAPLEAGLSGCALVLADIPTLREVWGAKAALYADPRDDQAWCDAIEWISADPSRWESFGQAARRRALRFTSGRQAEGYLSIYRQVIGEAAALSPIQVSTT